MHDTILYGLDIFGTFIFALSGAIKAIKNKLDILGVIVYAVTVGCAGGIIRDTMLGATPVGVYTDNMYVVVCVIAALLVIFFSKYVVGRWSLIVYCDALGLGVFCALGCNKAYAMGVDVIGIIICGMLSTSGGGVLRDLFSREVPMIFTSDFYASAGVIGSILFVLLTKTACPEMVIMWLVAIVVIVSRIIGYKCRLKLPVARVPIEVYKQ
ncbi:MAG: trimeric intracellular cation channel family protein [Spirochaetales bacterium]|nr:trimeric intracellular cation channel family protein [Spirochaetales bacterium]